MYQCMMQIEKDGYLLLQEGFEKVVRITILYRGESKPQLRCSMMKQMCHASLVLYFFEVGVQILSDGSFL